MFIRVETEAGAGPLGGGWRADRHGPVVDALIGEDVLDSQPGVADRHSSRSREESEELLVQGDCWDIALAMGVSKVGSGALFLR